MLVELEETWALAARLLARRLAEDLGPRVVSVQVVGARPDRHRRPPRDVDVLVVLAELDHPVTERIWTIGDEIEAELKAGLAIEITSPRVLDATGDGGASLWRMLDSGLPCLPSAPALPALPAAPGPRPVPAPLAPARVIKVSRSGCRKRAGSQVRAAETLLSAGLPEDALASAYQSIRSLAKGWLPVEALQGLPEDALLPALAEHLPGGPRGELARRVERIRRLAEDLENGATGIDPGSVRQVVQDVRRLHATLLPDSA